MSKFIHKARVVLEGGKLVGSFLFFNDAAGRPCFKFSLKPKLGAAEVSFEDKNTGERTKLTVAPPPEMSVDVSYKFDDRLLELKRQEPGKSPERHFIKTPEVPIAYLFSVRIKNCELLPVIPVEPGMFELKPPISAEKVAVIFSFVGEEGRPFMIDEYLKAEGRTIIIDLPNNPPFDKLYVGVVGESENNEPYDLTIKAPNYAPL